MLTWSTDSLRPQDRYDHWREVRGRHLGGVTMEIAPEQRAGFEGRFSAMPLGDALLSEICSTAYDVTRARADIERVSSDSLRVALLIDGAGWTETPRGGAPTVVGGLSTSYSDLPFSIAQRAGTQLHVRLLRIPLASRPALDRYARDFHTEYVVPDQPYARLLRTAFLALVAEAGRLLPAEAERAVSDIGQLALLMRGAVRAGAPESRRERRRDHPAAAQAIMASDFRQHDLSPDRVAERLGVSVRQLHVLFEPTGRTFHRALTALRVEEAKRRILADPRRAIAEIAFAAGFDSLPTFYRVFRAFDGHTPGDYRGAAASEPA